jgi:hypothetical protein
MFPARWIERDGPVALPTRLPDLMPMDFFLWGYTKEQIYHPQVTCLQDLKKKMCPQFCGRNHTSNV